MSDTQLEKKRAYEHARRGHIAKALQGLKGSLLGAGVHPWNLRTNLDTISMAIELINGIERINGGRVQVDTQRAAPVLLFHPPLVPSPSPVSSIARSPRLRPISCPRS
jgi:hypothetical protein